jgi:hypothetical protein
MKILDIIYEGRPPKNFWSDEHRQFMRSNFQKQAQLNTIAYDLGKDITSFIGGDINNGPQYSDSFGNTFKFDNVNFVKTHPQEMQPDSGIYKEKNAFIFNLTIDYRFYGDEIPHTLFTEPIRKMWDLINEKFSQTYDLSEFDFFIGIERMYYELGDSFGNVESDGHRKRNSISDLIPTGELWGSDRGLIKCDENFEQNLSKSNFEGDVKINRITYDKETLNIKYDKILKVLQKGDISLTRGNKEPLVVHYELKDTPYEQQRGFKYFTIPTYNYDTGEINSSKVYVRLMKSLEVKTDDPADNYRMGDIYMLVERKLITKFKQFNINLDIKFG